MTLYLLSPHLHSIHLIKEALEEFNALSRFSVNQNKSELYCVSVTLGLQHQILSSLQFKARNLPSQVPWRLGLPQKTGKLSSKDCTPLVDKIKASLNS